MILKWLLYDLLNDCALCYVKLQVLFDVFEIQKIITYLCDKDIKPLYMTTLNAL